jgi:hypothetical protein
MMAGGEPPVISNGSAYDHPCESLSGWTLTQDGNSTLTQTTFDGEEVFLADSGSAYDAANNAANLDASAFTPPGTALVVVSMRSYVTHLGNQGATFEMITNLIGYSAGARRLNCQQWADKITITDNSGTQIHHTPSTLIPLNQWYWLTFAITTATNLCDVYIDAEKVLTAVECGQPTGSGGRWSANTLNRNNAPYTRIKRYDDRYLVGDGFA